MDGKAKAHVTHFELKLPRMSRGMIFLSLMLTACAKSGGFQTGSVSNSSGNSSQSTTNPVPAPPASQTNSVFSAGFTPQALAWESSSHPERAAWSTTLYQIVSEHFTALDTAADIANFCPKYSSLTQDQKINLWADVFASDSYYESGWDPTEYSVDVGTQNDDTTWSVGLLQMSVVDQQNYDLSLGYNFADLQTPGDNFELGVTIMSLQISKYGTVLIDSGKPGLYWSTLDPGGKYDASASIEKTTKSLSFCQ